MNIKCKLAVLAALMASFGNADVLYTLTFHATIQTGSSPLSDVAFVYAGSDGSRSFIANSQAIGQCAANSTCLYSAVMEAFLPQSWNPSQYSVYSLLGFYDGGPVLNVDVTPDPPLDPLHPGFPHYTVQSNPRVALLADNSVDLTGADFNSVFSGTDELSVASNLYNGLFFGDRLAARNLVVLNPSDFPSLNFTLSNSLTGTGLGSAGTIYDFTSGSLNGSATIVASLQNTSAPEPSTIGSAAGGGLLLWLGRRRRRWTSCQ